MLIYERIKVVRIENNIWNIIIFACTVEGAENDLLRLVSDSERLINRELPAPSGGGGTFQLQTVSYEATLVMHHS